MNLWRELRLHSEIVMLTECSNANGKRVDHNYLEWNILKTYMAVGHWHPYFERTFSTRGHIRWVNAIAWARERLVVDTILEDKKNVQDGDYLLVADIAKVERRLLRQEKALGELATKELTLGQDIKKRKRVASDVSESDAVYIIVDPRRPKCCKIGAGNGDCQSRLREAKLWTNDEAELKVVEHVGSGRGLRIEWEVRRELRVKYLGQGEWVECSYLEALPVLREWADKSRRNQLLRP